VGITLRVKFGDAAALTNALNAGAYDLLMSTAPPAPSANAFLYNTQYSTGSTNRSRLKDPTLDGLIDRQASMSRDPEGRKKVLQETQPSMPTTAHLVGPNVILSPPLPWKYVKDFNTASPREEPFAQLWLDK